MSSRTAYRCTDCGAPTLRWAGRCPTCGEWNTIEEDCSASQASLPARASGGPARRPEGNPVQLGDLDPAAEPLMTTGVGELDRVLGGGLMPASVTLLAGEPGIGKSTLLLQMLAGLAARGRRCLLVSAEESLDQVHRRAARVGAVRSGLWALAEADLGRIRSCAADLGADVLVVDSIQTISDPLSASAPGTVSSVKGCAQQLVDDAKSGGPAVVMVGHVTKDGSIAGPRVLEHLVDTVLTFEGERHDALRLLRAVKHRFGAVGELGMWEMGGSGLSEVADAGALLLADRHRGTPGSVLFAAMEGRRPLLVEIQALVASATPGAIRRTASGYDSSRLLQLLAVLERRAGLSVAGQDVYVSAVGGVKLTDPGADLAVALAVASATTGRVVDEGLVVLGEVGLAGEIRRVANPGRRLSEAARLGFVRALAPSGALAPDGLVVAPATTLSAALDEHLGVACAPPRLRVVASAGPAL